MNSRSEENFIRNTSIFGAWNTAYSMEYVEYGWNTGGIQASGRSFGIRGKRIQTVGTQLGESRHYRALHSTCFPFLPAGVGHAGGAAGVRDVCGPESDVCVSALRLFQNIEG